MSSRTAPRHRQPKALSRRRALWLSTLLVVVGWPNAGDAKEGLKQVRHLVLRPLDGPFSDSERSCEDQRDPWCQKSFSEKPVAASPTVSFPSIGIVLRKRTQQYWLDIDMPRGSFYSHAPVGTAKPDSELGYCKRQEVGRMVLVTWSWGMGVIDPPDSSYTACEHRFVLCALDAEIPRCSASITAARAKQCDPDRMGDLRDEVPDARVLPDGQTFEIYGRLYTASPPGAAKR